jgi:hypothetical protein
MHQLKRVQAKGICLLSSPQMDKWDCMEVYMSSLGDDEQHNKHLFFMARVDNFVMLLLRVCSLP